jgi:hypothetical protein
MRAFSRSFALGLVVLAAVGSHGCKTEKAEVCPSSCPYDYASFEAGEPVSFKDEVFPLMRQSCAKNTCHGPTDPTKADGKLYLGPPASDQTVIIDLALRQQVGANLVGKDSATAPAMKIVAAGDPANSFLMLKVDGCQETAGLACKSPDDKVSGCGDRMPDGDDGLCEPQRDVFRRWIKQGAVID